MLVEHNIKIYQFYNGNYIYQIEIENKMYCKTNRMKISSMKDYYFCVFIHIISIISRFNHRNTLF